MPTALITGGSRGIGYATAYALRRRGWKVLVPPHVECDVQDAISIQSYILRLKRTHMIQYIDALVLNAHKWYSNEIHAQRWYSFHDQYDYVIGHWYLMRDILLCSNSLKSVVGISSMRGLIGGVNTAPYSMAKAALIAMMQGFAREYPNVRFNTVAPGWTATEMGDEIKATDDVYFTHGVAQDPAIVADAIVYLLDVNSTTNGITLKVDSGITEKVAWKEV